MRARSCVWILTGLMSASCVAQPRSEAGRQSGGKGEAVDPLEVEIEAIDCDAAHRVELAKALTEETTAFLRAGDQADYLATLQMEFPHLDFARQDPIARGAVDAFAEALFQLGTEPVPLQVTFPLRTLAEAFLLYENNCPGAQPPGESAEELGLAIRARPTGGDEADHRRWHDALTAQGFFRPDEGDPTRYVYGIIGDRRLADERAVVQEASASLVGSIRESVRKTSVPVLRPPRARLSVAVFQRRWNLSRPEDASAMSGDFGKATRSRLLRALTEGLADGPEFAPECRGPITPTPVVCLSGSATAFELLVNAPHTYLSQARLKLQPDGGPVLIRTVKDIWRNLQGEVARATSWMHLEYRVDHGSRRLPRDCDPHAASDDRVDGESDPGSWSPWKPLEAPPGPGSSIGLDGAAPGTIEFYVHPAKRILAWEVVEVTESKKPFARRWELRKQQTESELLDAFMQDHRVELRIKPEDHFFNFQQERCVVFEVRRDVTPGAVVVP